MVIGELVSSYFTIYAKLSLVYTLHEYPADVPRENKFSLILYLTSALSI